MLDGLIVFWAVFGGAWAVDSDDVKPLILTPRQNVHDGMVHFSNGSLVRVKRLGFPAAIPVVPAAPVYGGGYGASYSAPAYSYSAPAYSYSAPAYSYSAPAYSYGYSPAIQTFAQPVAQPIAQPIAQPVAQPVAQPSIIQPIQEIQPQFQPAAQVAQPIQQPLAQSQPVQQPFNQPFIRPGGAEANAFQSSQSGNQGGAFQGGQSGQFGGQSGFIQPGQNQLISGQQSFQNQRLIQQNQFQEELPRYPLPGCYNDTSLFLCCNCQLESLMEQSYWQFRREQPQLSNANTQKIANLIQRNAEQMFNEKFEIIVGLGDFAIRSHFYRDLLCKIEREGRYIVAYASPQEEAEYFEESINGFNPVLHGVQHKSIYHCDAHTSANLNRELFQQTINPYTLNKYATVGDRWQNLAFKWRI